MQISSLRASTSYTINISQQHLPPVLVLVNLWVWTQPSSTASLAITLCCIWSSSWQSCSTLLFLSGVCGVKILTIHPMNSTVWCYGNRHGTPRVLSQTWGKSELIVRLQQRLVPRSAVVWKAPVMVCWTTRNLTHQSWISGQNNVTKWIHGPILAYQFVHLINACVMCVSSTTDPGVIPGKCSDFWTGEREEPHLDFSISVIVFQCSQNHCCLCNFGDR